jgi:uncharacterized protein (DUF1501 family)
MSVIGLGFRPSPFLVRSAEAASAARTLVAIFQRGAADGLNMVVPYGDTAYYNIRSTVAIPPPGADGGAIDLDGYFGFHPALAPLKPLYSAGELAVVHAVGSHDSTRSHFDAQDFMETAVPGVKSIRDGWLNRAAGEVPGDSVLEAVSVSNRIPRALQGPETATAIRLMSDFDLRVRGWREDAARELDAMYGSAANLVGRTGRETLEAVRLVQAVAGRIGGPENGASYPAGSVGTAMQQAAQLIRSELGVRIVFVDVPGWDHHANQNAQLQTELTTLARAMAAFHQDLGPRMAEVVVLTMTEFGRTAGENGSNGTDHGHASVMLLLGGTVRGGRVYGRWPGLSPALLNEGRDLSVTTDFREVFAEAARAQLGVADARAVFPGWAPAAPPGIIG